MKGKRIMAFWRCQYLRSWNYGRWQRIVNWEERQRSYGFRKGNEARSYWAMLKKQWQANYTYEMCEGDWKVRVRGQTWSSLDATAFTPRLIDSFHGRLYKVQKWFSFCLTESHWTVTVGLPHQLRYCNIKMFAHIYWRQKFISGPIHFFLRTVR